ncbi:hypothetical protein KBZ21_01685 [Streptomyces sp. A73]|uniref:hypothetical protein n=1 Tax=Streptomyces TaxID=1883 RepID=UPI000C1A6C0D|nr:MULTISPECIES: hypothetical protein [unclassified Streptomyces]MBQ0867299.1 hypothetical protein [Streptomyces sp. RK75]MBQ1119791.1 hypothetical protein [Streptomyces sp. B15]MBQ1156892.1 hypothetical protein [Streptomyces sp. A73]
MVAGGTDVSSPGAWEHGVDRLQALAGDWTICLVLRPHAFHLSGPEQVGADIAAMVRYWATSWRMSTSFAWEERAREPSALVLDRITKELAP